MTTYKWPTPTKQTNGIAGVAPTDFVTVSQLANSSGTPAGTDTQVQFNSANVFGASANLTFDYNTNLLTTANLTVSGLTSLGNVGNVFITGGTPGQVIATDGAGNLSFTNAGGTTATIPFVYFVAPTTGNNQSFSNVVLSGYANAQAMTVFCNGTLIENTDYSLAGDVLTMNVVLNTNDTIEVVATTVAGNVVQVISGYGDSNVTALLSGGTFSNNIVTTANVSGAYILGDGSQLTGLPANYGDSNVATLLNSGSLNSNIVTQGSVNSGNATITGTVTTPNLVLSNISSSLTAITIDPLGDASPTTGNVVVLGNLAVTGNLTYTDVSTAQTSNLVWQAASTATNPVDASGGGLAVGPAGNSYATFTYNVLSNDWNTNIPLSVTGTVSAANVITTNNIQLSGTGELFVQTNNSHGGFDYAGIMTMTNTSGGATNPNKFLRLNPTGSLEVVNSDYSSVILSLTDTGNLNTNYYFGNGSQLTGISSISNGNTNVSISSAGGNVTMDVAGSPLFSLTPLSVVIGSNATGNINIVSVGIGAGETNQQPNGVALGTQAGQTNQGTAATAVGYQAGQTSQGQYTVAVGHNAGSTSQGDSAIAIGSGAGITNQGVKAVAIGDTAGGVNQGNNAIAIGYYAANNNQASNSIILNASGDPHQATNSGFYILPVRQDLTSTAVTAYYNNSTSELTTAPTMSAFAGFQAPVSGQITNAMMGQWIQANNNITLPNAATVPGGTIFTIFSSGSQVVPITVSVFNASTDFIYMPPQWGNTTRSVPLYYGQWMTVLSRGTGEWDVIASNIQEAFKVAFSPVTAWDTPLALDNLNVKMGTDGYMYMSAVSGTIVVKGSALTMSFGNGPANDTLSNTSLSSGTWTKVTANHSLGTNGDSITATVQDVTNNRIYRITTIKNLSGPNQGSISIERTFG